jgi:hypothetical protein
MGAQGSTVIDFGALPGTDHATVAVIGQTAILASSLCEAWIDPTQGATADHSVDEHIMGATMMTISCSNLVAGTGFTINATGSSSKGFMEGKYNVSWVWA